MHSGSPDTVNCTSVLSTSNIRSNSGSIYSKIQEKDYQPEIDPYVSWHFSNDNLLGSLQWKPEILQL